MQQKFDLEERLIKFACSCINICEALPFSKIAQVIEGQLLRSASGAALNYGEAQAAESHADFVHKLKLSLKEIRESRVALKIIYQKPLLDSDFVQETLVESGALIAIFRKSILTSQQKNADKKTT